MTPVDSANADRAVRLSRIPGLLLRRVRAQAHGITGLTLSQESIVALLLDAPAGMSGAELARAEGVRAQTMSTAVAALEKGGYVRGEPDPADGRRRILFATETGAQALARSLEAKQRWLEEVLAGYTPEDLRALDAGLDVLERIVDS